MGQCLKKPMERPFTNKRRLTRELRRDREIDNLRKKLLILGPKRSGKSTIFNQLKYIHGNGFNRIERIEAKQLIITFVIQSMQNIIACIQEYEKYKQFPIHKFSLNDEAKSSAEFIKSLSLSQPCMNQLILSHFQILINQTAVKKS